MARPPFQTSESSSTTTSSSRERIDSAAFFLMLYVTESPTVNALEMMAVASINPDMISMLCPGLRRTLRKAMRTRMGFRALM